MTALQNPNLSYLLRIRALARRCIGDLLDGLFLDIPYILDSAWRRAEFNLNRAFTYQIDASGGTRPPLERPYWQQPPCWFFVVTLVFVAFGPTFDALCSVLGVKGSQMLRDLGVYTCYGLAVAQFAGLGYAATTRSLKRFQYQNITSWLRRAVVLLAFLVAIVGSLIPWHWLATSLRENLASLSCMPNAPAGPAWTLLAVCAAAVLAALFITSRTQRVWGRVFGETVVLALMLLVLWKFVAPDKASEAQQVPYVHLFGIVAMALALVACLSPLLMGIVQKSLSAQENQQCRQALTTTELFPGPYTDPPLTWRRVFASLVLGILTYPLHLLLLPSVFVVLSTGQQLWVVAIGWTLAAAALVAMCSLSNSWRLLLVFVSRWFLTGTPLIVSLLVILLAILRLAGFQYVATILDVAPFGAVFFWVVMSYVLFWWFEYHVNAVAVAKHLKVLGASQDRRCESVAYVLDPDCVNSTHTTIERSNRWVVPHSVGRVAVLGWFRHSKTREPTEAYNTYGIVELFNTLLSNRDAAVSQDIERRMHLYFAAVNLCLIFIAGVLGVTFNRGDQDNTVKALVRAELAPAPSKALPSPDPAGQEPTSSQHADLTALFEQTENSSRPAIVIAASGGGTRAALYTAAGLEALGKLGRARDVVLLSGVSGGGVASAYFYAHHRELSTGSATQRQDQWDLFRKRMREPFISDVLEGAIEWRIFLDEPLGALLAESFQRRLFDADATLGHSKDVGLLLNTTLSGHPLAFTALLGKTFTTEQTPLPAPEPSSTGQTLAAASPGTAELNCPALTRPLNNLSGGRLVFTNFSIEAPWDEALDPLPDVRMPFVPVSDTRVPLAKAAALTANFPPVFPNARIDLWPNGKFEVGCPDSFYVTDGGATENLGLISALLAVRSTLDKMKGKPVREIHVVAFEASAFGYDYQQDRGLGAATGGSKERLTGALTLRLINDINQRLRDRGTVEPLHIHYLPLPTVFRSRGGFGTHWMAPKTIELQNPRVAYQVGGWARFKACHFNHTDTPCSVQLDRDELREIWQELFSSDAAFCANSKKLWSPGARRPSKDLNQVARWICGFQSADGKADLLPDFFIRAWQKLVEDLPPLPSAN